MSSEKFADFGYEPDPVEESAPAEGAIAPCGTYPAGPHYFPRGLAAMEFSEIGEVLGCSAQAAQKSYQSAIRKLQQRPTMLARWVALVAEYRAMRDRRESGYAKRKVSAGG